MDWKEFLAAVLPAVFAFLGVAVPVLLKWLKTQEIVQKAHLEGLLDTMVPAIVEWVEVWAEDFVKTYDRKPGGKAKLEKAVEYLQKEIPRVEMTGELVKRIEAALRKRKEN